MFDEFERGQLGSIERDIERGADGRERSSKRAERPRMARFEEEIGRAAHMHVDDLRDHLRELRSYAQGHGDSYRDIFYPGWIDADFETLLSLMRQRANEK